MKNKKFFLWVSPLIKFSEAIKKKCRVINFLESTSRGCSKYDKGNVQLYLWNCRYSKLCSKISTDRFVIRNYEDFKIHFLVVEQEIFQTFATKNHPEVDLAGLIFDGLPVKLVKDACPIARRQAADLVSYCFRIYSGIFWIRFVPELLLHNHVAKSIHRKCSAGEVGILVVIMGVN